MLVKEFEDFIFEAFTSEKLDLVKGKGEYGFTYIGSKNITKIGYCTNLTIESAEEAARNKVDLLITHHDAWTWMEGMKEETLKILEDNDITHFYIHGPLDDADFGNNVSILNKLGFKVVDKFANEDGMYCGRIGAIENSISFQCLVEKIETLLEEPVRAWKNNNNMIKRIGVITGAGFSATYINEAIKLGCDTFFTGEKILYTVEYAKYRNINLIVGSHTFTEIFGLESLCELLNKRCPNIEVIRIVEEHFE